jgi:Zn-dependent protease with chaperone function
MPTPLPSIASTAWEHPADRAALNALRALPGFDEVVRKVAGFVGERALRHLYTANAVRVGPRQRPKLDSLYTEVIATLDWPDRPELFVSQTPIVNAMAVGFDRPFIVMNSSLLELLDREERRVILAHELGHVMSGHNTYRTIAILLLTVGLSNLPMMVGAALLPFHLAILDWYRKSEFSADRAGLLGSQDERVTMNVFMKLAGGVRDDDDSTDLAPFMEQAAEYETKGGAWDTFLKLLNTAFRDHPFATVRAAELQRWIDSGGYTRIMAGEYQRRGDPPPQNLAVDFAEAGGYYRQQAEAAAQTVTDSFGRARDAFNDAFRKKNGA